MADDRIGVLDFGGQYAHLIAKRIRDLGVHSQIFSGDCRLEELQGLKGIILSGGPSSVSAGDAPEFDTRILTSGIPVLGLCYGHQLVAYHLGGEVSKGRTREYGKATVQVSDSVLLHGMDAVETVWMSHFDTVTRVPEGFTAVASTDICPIAAMEDPSRKIFSTQFHPEVTHTPHGMMALENFVAVTGALRTWNVESYIPLLFEKIKTDAKGRKVFMLVSGGVDSTVCFVLLNKALGKDRVYGLHVDHGLMRKDESALVTKALNAVGLDNFAVVDASERFLKALEGVLEPEIKRNIIGNLFLEVQKEEFVRLGLNADEWVLGQGTLYPDTIESGGTKHADKIKTHHNRIPEIMAMIEKGLVVEPVADLYKDEVRKVGVELGLPDELVWRHTFPGPGLAVQELCAATVVYPENKQKLESDIGAMVASAGLRPFILPVRSVGVQGDERTYRSVVALQGEADWKTLEDLATTITNTFPAVNRVVWLVKPAAVDLGSMTVKHGTLTRARLDLHREADALANQILRKHKLERELYEFPVVMIPVSFAGGESIALRPLYSENVMTVDFAKLPRAVVQEMADAIGALPGIDAVFYDVTNKPPATVQWE
ncbi:hypothetical protein AUK40_03810 [Candidatus Wirthbacteria bacterium CG2_30_54_11]|uniref:GMP synthase (glutamine-hydrolyzing) n=1 Tax=Candidatus Wirthbacteria bacterium CG2_30_54_11 TaxID=1817892 RepID=A0A1J5IKB9_9BACT|nr:MAG: hypothetical protein AUK40_03810 [Candidatus Wirthbacteria bacterium CG2_30_54_11]